MSFQFGWGPAGSWPNWLGRAATFVMFTFYPIGAMLRLAPSNDWMDLGGLGLMIVAGLVAAAFSASYAYQLSHAHDDLLDERERQVRHKAHTLAYSGLAALLISALIYMQLAHDQKWWMPSDGDHWKTLFWGGIIAVFTFPAASLVWTEPAHSHDNDE
ncbi:hypothetical protein [Aquidulcibacter sp.]|uniref:hypothetical protein n=1 Tax=Aquidulcibacter sp. TaxID=2052990 RepID=UPI0025C48D78|nr:hypothetical protein [Aquidulcibacter sp.]MCA3692887.1 hypothetical protein [Aquidulcibacter sp.]